MKKRFLAILPALALCLGLAAPAFAVDAGNATQKDTESTFTILRNGKVDETTRVYASSKKVPILTVDGVVDMACLVFDDNDSWTITNTGSKAISAGGSTSYTLSFGFCQYGRDPWSGTDALGEIGGSGTLGLEADGSLHFIYGGPADRPVELRAGESVTIPADILYKNPAADSACEVIILISFDSGETLVYSLFFAYDPVEKAAIDAKLSGGKPVFTDVPQWCAPAVDWAVEQGITKGYGNNDFRPDVPCTHAQILTFLWRAAGCPDPEDKAPVVVESYYQDGVDWAYGEGLVDDTSFVPGAPCTRGSAMLYIWNAFGQMGADGHGFNDIPPEDEALNLAVNFAAAGGIANGFSNIDGTYSFRPNSICSRGHIVTFLYRAYVPEARLP